MGIAGNLKTMALAELLQWLSQGQKTGTLVIDGGEVEKRVFFKDGTIFSSASTDAREYLGSFLVSHGYLSQAVVDEAVARQEAEKLLIGKILVNMGAISEEDLQQMLRLKAEESIYDIFTWEEGAFEFFDNQLPQKTMIPMSLDVHFLILEGSRRLDEWNRVKGWIPSSLVVPVAMVDLQTLQIDEVDQRILSWVDDERCVKDISDGSQTSLFLVSQVLANQVQAGTLKAIKPRIVEKVIEKIVEKVIEKEVPVRDGTPTYAMPAYYPPAYPPQPPAYPPPHQIYAAPGVEVGGRAMHYAVAPGAPPPTAPAAYPPQPSAPPPATAPSAEAERVLQEAEEHLRGSRLDAALTGFRKARALPGNDPVVERRSRDGESRVQQAVERAGFGPKAVPKLKCSLDQLTQLDISPQEGFMLTRIDGSFDLGSLLKLSPMPKLDAQIFFWRLKNSGHLSV